MFAVSYQRTMAGAKPKFREPEETVRSIELIRREKREEIERVRRAEAQAWADRVRAEREEHRKRLQSLQAVSEYRVLEIREPASCTPARIIVERVAAFHAMKPAQIFSHRRDRKTMAARHDAIRAVAEARPDMSLPQIGRVFGGRDHTTILHSLRKTTNPGFDYRGNRLAIDGMDPNPNPIPIHKQGE